LLEDVALILHYSPIPLRGVGEHGEPVPTAFAAWMETKIGSYRVQDRADVVQVIKAAAPATLRKIRKHLGKTHAIYLQRFDELLEAAEQEKEQERERGGGRTGG
jgi:hypothetical protein